MGVDERIVMNNDQAIFFLRWKSSSWIEEVVKVAAPFWCVMKKMTQSSREKTSLYIPLILLPEGYNLTILFHGSTIRKDRSSLVLSDDYYYSGDSTLYLYQRVFNEWCSRSGEFFWWNLHIGRRDKLIYTNRYTILLNRTDTLTRTVTQTLNYTQLNRDRNT